MVELDELALAAAIAAGNPKRSNGGRYHLLSHRQGNQVDFTYTPLDQRAGGQLLLAEIAHGWPLDAVIHAEGLQMLQQWHGTVAMPRSVGRCGDASGYGFYSSKATPRLYNLLLVATPHKVTALAFTSAQPVSGYFELDGPRLRLFVDLDGWHPAIGIGIAMPSVLVVSATDADTALSTICSALPSPPALSRALTGWCSWYHYYADVSAADVGENLQQMTSHWPELDYVLLDDGYQAQMGDWLVPSDRFEGGIGPLIAKIHKAGKQPALWLAPFVASGQSQLFREHPDWFVRGEDGFPLAAGDVTFGGWRQTPWYMLDGSHPEVCDHLRQLFAHLRSTYGIRLFKLDALLWGAMPFGHRYRAGMSANDSYRCALQAMREGAGESLLLGCNAPLWPSLGLVDAMRIGDDIERNQRRMVALAHELAGRRWTHRRLWLADPDCLTFQDAAGQHAEPGDYRLHAALCFAFGGVVISGDRLQLLASEPQRWLRALLVLQAQGFDGVSLNPLTNGASGWGAAPHADGWLVVVWRSPESTLSGAGRADARHVVASPESPSWSLPLPSGDWCWHELLRDLRGQGPCTLAGDMAAKADGAVLLLRPRM